METLIIMAVIYFASKAFANNVKKKAEANKKTQQTAQQPNSRQQQAIEEQRRRRAAYEEMLRQQQEENHKRQMQRMFGTAEDEEKAMAEATAEIREPHHIDEEEERRCAEAEAKKEKERKLKVSQRELKRELLQRYGSLEERQSLKPRPQSLSQAQKQLHIPAVALQTVQATELGNKPITRLWSEEDSTTQDMGVRNLGMKSNTWAQGIVMAEILGPPRSKKRQIR